MQIESHQVGQDPGVFGSAEILEPLIRPMEELNVFLNSQIDLFEPELQGLVRYALEHKGKRIRPMLVFYSGWNGEGEVSEYLIKIAGVMELTHLATLVHDDILDEAIIRHSMSTVFNNYGPKMAVLLGDALFSHALVLAAEFESKDICMTIAGSIRRVCAGEIKQTFHSSKETYSFEDYYRIIDLKTAELFYVSCLLGARLGGFSEEYANAVASFGRNMGIAYQIYDDLVDILGNEQQVGKTLGTDFASGKHTLPTLKLVDKLSLHDRLEFLQGIKEGRLTIEQLKSMLIQHGVLAEVFGILKARIEKAGHSIASYKNLPSFSHLMKIQDLVFNQVRCLEESSFN